MNATRWRRAVLFLLAGAVAGAGATALLVGRGAAASASSPTSRREVGAAMPAEASPHSLAGAAVDQQRKAAASLLEAGELERAAEVIRTIEAPHRRAAAAELAAHAHRAGRRWAERGNHRQGCAIWKLAFALHRADAELNRAVAGCSRRAVEALRGPGGCEAVALARALAVEGDGVGELALARDRALGCH